MSQADAHIDRIKVYINENIARYENNHALYYEAFSHKVWEHHPTVRLLKICDIKIVNDVLTANAIVVDSFGNFDRNKTHKNMLISASLKNFGIVRLSWHYFNVWDMYFRN